MTDSEIHFEIDLVGQARNGDREAMASIYTATYPELWRTARALVKNEDDARDILQDAYLKAFTHLDQLADPAALRPWLRQITANTARKYLSSRKPLLFSELTEEDGEPFPDVPDPDESVLPETALDRKETYRLVRETLETLSDEQRLVLGMYYYEDQPIRAIAQTLELPENTVKSHLRRGRKRVEETLRELEKQGLRLFGLAPLSAFRIALHRQTAELAVPAPAQVTKRIAADGAAALSRGTVRAVKAGSHLLRRVLAAAAAGGVIGGAVWGVGRLVRQKQPAPPDPIPDTSVSTSLETEAPKSTLEHLELPAVLHLPGNSYSGESKEFTGDGWKITLTDRFTEAESEMGFDGYYTSPYCGVMILKEPFSLQKGLEDQTLEEYIVCVMENNNQAGHGLEMDGLIYYRYTRDGRSGWNYAFKGSEAFYLVQFICRDEDTEQLEDLIFFFAKSVTVE